LGFLNVVWDVNVWLWSDEHEMAFKGESISLLLSVLSMDPGKIIQTLLDILTHVEEGI